MDTSNHSRFSVRSGDSRGRRTSRHRSSRSPSPFRSRRASRFVPPPRPRFMKGNSTHMLPTSNLSPNKAVFSSKHRLIKRNLPFYQSENVLQVANQHGNRRLFSLLLQDWFHVGLRANLWLSLVLLLSVWTLALFVFAGIYMRIDQNRLAADCGLGPPDNPIQFSPAFAFSLETCTTVGYGLPNGSNAFFENECPDVIAAIYFQMVWSMMFNAFLFAFFFARIAKSESRGIQVIFSNKAIISHRTDVPSYPCFQYRVFDIDGTYPVVEAHVRTYLVTQRSPIPIPLRIVIPNDELGGMLYLSLPSQVVHAMDAYSPMVPKSRIKCTASATVPRDGLHLRQVDGSTNNRDDVICPVCGESYGTAERLIKHGKFNKMTEAHDGIPYKGSHQEVDWDEWANLLKKSTTWTIQQLQAFFRSEISEVLCIVEGIDPLTSGTFSAIHSYQLEDIHFGEAHFSDCVCLDMDQNVVVDLDFFHKITPNVAVANMRDDESDFDVASRRPWDDTELSMRSTHSSIIRRADSGDSYDSTAAKFVRAPPGNENGKNAPSSIANQSNIAPSAPSPLTPTTPAHHRGDESNLEPRNLMYDLKSSEHQTPFGDLVEPRVVKTEPTFRSSMQSSSGSTAASAVPQAPPPTQQNSEPKQPRRASEPSATENERPPPLFTLDSDLQGAETGIQSTGRQPNSRSVTMPGNMMNSLATGKF